METTLSIKHAIEQIVKEKGIDRAVVIEAMEQAVLTAQSKFGGTLTRLSVERLDAVGGKQAFRPAMTVTQWNTTKPRVVTP